MSNMLITENNMPMKHYQEYGGYLPLELEKRQEYYVTTDYYEVRRYNSGRAAIYQAVVDSGATRVWLPVYLCDTVLNFLARKNVRVELYNIDKSFLPSVAEVDNRIHFCDGDIVVWTTYYGINTKESVHTVLKRYPNLIIDNTQSFFLPPQEGAYNIYSCRKFFGVPDGSYLIKGKFHKEDKKLSASNSEGTCRYLIDSIETSTNGAYRESIDNESRITAEDVMAMSKFTSRVMESVDYEKNIKIRLENYKVYAELLGNINELNSSDSINIEAPNYAPMVYPLLLKNNELRRKLVSNSIYVPQWWKKVQEDDLSNQWERYISEYLLPLPIDQRYDKEDMKYIANFILESI